MGKKWGTFKLGDGTKWGASGLGPIGGNQWIVLVDWAGAGVWSGVNEAQWMTDYNLTRGRKHYVTKDGGFEQLAPGTVTLTMKNMDGRYDPYNTTSPLYPNIKPGATIVILVRDVANNISHYRFAGFIDDIVQNSADNTVTITASDGLGWMAGIDEVSSPTIEYNVSFDAAYRKVLDLSKYPTAFGQNIQPWSQPLMVFDMASIKPDVVCLDLADASLGTFFFAADGKPTYYPLNYSGMTIHDIDQTQLLTEIELTNPWETVRNIVKVVCEKRTKQKSGRIWTWPYPIGVKAGQSKTMVAKYSASDSVGGIVYLANTSTSTSGTDITPQMTLEATPNSTSCALKFTNNSGTDGYVLHVYIEGSAFTIMPVEFKQSQTDGKRSFILDNGFIQDTNYADVFSGLLLDFLEVADKAPIVQIEQRPDIQFSIELFDHWHLSIPAKNIDDTFSVAGIDESWTGNNPETGQAVLTRYYLQKVIYSADAIDPAPTDPDVPDPIIVPPGGGGIIYPPGGGGIVYPPDGGGTPWLGGGGGCIPCDGGASGNVDCYADDAMVVGPYDIGIHTELNADESNGADISTQVVATDVKLRASSATNLSEVVITGYLLMKNSSNEWEISSAVGAIEIWGLTNVGEEYVKATSITIGGGQIIGTFTPSVMTNIYGIKIKLLPDTDTGNILTTIQSGNGTSLMAELVATGTVQATQTTSNPTQIDGLIDGDFYFIKSSGGPYYWGFTAPGTNPDYHIKVNFGGGWEVGGTYISTGIAYYSFESGYHNWMYFQARSNGYVQIITDWGGDYHPSGSLNWTLTHIIGGSLRKLAINSVALMNVCAQS